MPSPGRTAMRWVRAIWTVSRNSCQVSVGSFQIEDTRQMAKPAQGMGYATEWDRDAALTTSRMLLEIDAIRFRPEEPFTFTSGWKSPVYIDCRRIIYFPRV